MGIYLSNPGVVFQWLVERWMPLRVSLRCYWTTNKWFIIPYIFPVLYGWSLVMTAEGRRNDSSIDEKMLLLFCRDLWSGGEQKCKPTLFYSNCSLCLSGIDTTDHPRVHRAVPHNRTMTQLPKSVVSGSRYAATWWWKRRWCDVLYSKLLVSIQEDNMPGKLIFGLPNL